MSSKISFLILILIFCSSCGVKKKPKRGEDVVIQSYLEGLKSQPNLPVQNKTK